MSDATFGCTFAEGPPRPQLRHSPVTSTDVIVISDRYIKLPEGSAMTVSNRGLRLAQPNRYVAGGREQGRRRIEHLARVLRDGDITISIICITRIDCKAPR